jgi:protease I
MDVEIGKLRGKKIAILAADGFEYIELAVPRKALRFAGAETDVISIHPGKIRGMNHTEPTRAVPVAFTLDEVESGSYDALFVPGGFIGPDLLRQSRKARTFVRAFEDVNKPIATLCHGPWVLVSAELVAGRRLASWPGIRDDIVHAGGIWRDEPVVRDANWVTSRGPQDLKAFIRAMVALYAGTAPAMTELGAQANDMTSSPQHDEPPALAVAAARYLPGPTVRTFLGGAAATVLAAIAVRRAAG